MRPAAAPGRIRFGWAEPANLISSLPALLVFVFFQRYFITGLTLGAVKG